VKKGKEFHLNSAIAPISNNDMSNNINGNAGWCVELSASFTFASKAS